MTNKSAAQYLKTALTPLYGAREAELIGEMVMEKISGQHKIARFLQSGSPLTPDQQTQLEAYLQQLSSLRPVQYVLGEAWFAGMPFHVNENILIPRPETEELVEWVTKKAFPDAHILDIGTGSGCIAVALKKKLRQSAVWAADISEEALEIARQNATGNDAEIIFCEMDILDRTAWPRLPQMDIIVSNPPYICQKEKAAMSPNVLQYEPGLALFVPDEAPLLFYRAIADFARQNLKPNGQLFFEINESYGAETVRMLEGKKFAQIELRKDMQQKDRMVRAVMV